jgi:hypothetical protein
MKNLKIFLGALSVSAILAVTGCAVYPAHDRGYGPPPHAPAHGYRYVYHDHELVYDSGLGVYVVIGHPDYYFLRNSYYRYGDGIWYYSREFDNGWKRYSQNRLPPGLAKKYPGRGRGRR